MNRKPMTDADFDDLKARFKEGLRFSGERKKYNRGWIRGWYAGRVETLFEQNILTQSQYEELHRLVYKTRIMTQKHIRNNLKKKKETGT